MSDEWKNEDAIKAELRTLTDELRTLRQELGNMVSRPAKNNPARAFLHRQPWPATARPPTAGEQKSPPQKPDVRGRKKR
jgi:hypothetical protein